MIEQQAPATPGTAPPRAVPGGCATAWLPVRPGTARLLVLAGVFVCAACGLVYELVLVALASYLMGDSVTQASVVLSVMVFAMGVGSLAAKRLRRRAAVAFGAVEAVLALVGGCSAMVLYALFAWTGDWGGPWTHGPRILLVGFSLAVGLLIGAEVPLLMELIQRIRRQDAGGAVADLFAADYVGALIGGLAFPFLLLPHLGQLSGALVTGTVNAVVGAALVLGLFRRDLTRRHRRLLLAGNAAVLALLAAATVLVDDFERAARQAVYGPEVRVALQTEVQEVVLTGGDGSDVGDGGDSGVGGVGGDEGDGGDSGVGGVGGDEGDGGSGRRPLELFLNGRLRVGGGDPHRYHEALVHPALAGRHARVLVLGGGDGLAVREVLRHTDVRRVDVVVLDPELARLARHDPALSALNEHAHRDPRVHSAAGDAFRRLRGTPAGTYDVVISDLPDPGLTAGAKLYSREFYVLARRVLAPGGRFVVHAGPAGSQPGTFWTVESTLRAAGFRTAPYQVTGPGAAAAGGTAGAAADWGFVLARTGTAPELRLAAEGPRPHTLTGDSLAAGARAAAGTRVPGLPPSTLVHPRY
ncbi:spermine/spermidine synthase domain-containing protein [Streptomyces poriticola]|uniref:spermine/spermidine synthase domain-containing protein n=1 Tax=Streptomyces poriticola TaxID=3120506 RepID=UPI002FCE596B